METPGDAGTSLVIDNTQIQVDCVESVESSPPTGALFFMLVSFLGNALKILHPITVEIGTKTYTRNSHKSGLTCT